VNYSGLVTLLICSLSAVVSAIMLPYVAGGRTGPLSQRREISVWAVVVGLTLMLMAVVRLDEFKKDGFQAIAAITLSATLIAGIYASWVASLISGRAARIAENPMFAALLLAPLATVFLASLFSGRINILTVVIWFGNGFLWQAICTGVFRRLDPHPRPRPGPPDLGVRGCYRKVLRHFPRPAEF
jgi:hypothetical protein